MRLFAAVCYAHTDMLRSRVGSVRILFGDLRGMRREGVVILRMVKGPFKGDSLEVLTPTREAVHVVSVTSLGCEDIRQRGFSDDKSDLPFVRRDFQQ